MGLKYFKYSEFDQNNLPGSGEQFMDQTLLCSLDALRHKCGFPFVITSGYRTPEYNNKVSSTGFNGPHTTGKAVDIAVSRQQAFYVLRNALSMNIFTGIGVQQKGSRRFIHLDILTQEESNSIRPTIWSY